MVLVAIMSSYLFLGRNLTKLGNNQLLEAKSRLAISHLSRDIQLASVVSSPSATSVTLTLPGGNVTYSYSSGVLSRSATFGAFQNMSFFQGDGTAFAFNYYNTTGSALTSTSLVPVSVKLMDFSFTLQRGSSLLGTAVQLQVMSSRYVVGNKQLPDGT